MAVKIRLQRHGRKQNPYYKIVVADARSPRDGKFIERLGFYNPMTVPATIEIDREKALEWIQKGAQPTDTVRAILRFKGVLFRKHLLRGVSKGAMTQEQADAKWDEFTNQKEQKVAGRRKKVEDQKAAFLQSVSGTAKAPKAKEEPVAEEVAAEESATEESASEETAAEAPVMEAPASEAPAVEEVAEAPAAEESAPEATEAASEEAPAE